MRDATTDCIFYLKLSPNLTEKYFVLDAEFKTRGYTLIPVSLSDLIPLIQAERKFYVMTLADSIADLKYFRIKVYKVLKYLLRSKRVFFHLVSSFELLNHTYEFGKDGHYQFTKLPVNLLSFCDTIENTLITKQTQADKWPGTSRRLGSTIS